MSRSTKESLLARWSRVKRESIAQKDEASATIARDRDEDRNASESGKSGVEAKRRGEQYDSSQLDSRKRDSNEQERIKKGDDAGLQLPALDELGPDSDYQAFMDPGVDDETRRAALKILFRDPAFNVTDGLDVYAADYSKLEKLTPAMVAALRYAQRNLFGERDSSQPDASAASAANEGDAGEPAKTADESLQSGEAGPVAAAAADGSGSSGDESNAGDGDEQVGIRAGMADRSPMPGEQTAEQQKESGRKNSGTRGG